MERNVCRRSALLLNNAAPGVPAQQALSTALVDLNGDGCIDAAVTDSYGVASVYTGNCAGGFNVPPLTQAAVGDIGGAIQLVDMNRDGKLDLVTSGVVERSGVTWSG